MLLAYLRYTFFFGLWGLWLKEICHQVSSLVLCVVLKNSYWFFLLIGSAFGAMIRRMRFLTIFII